MGISLVAMFTLMQYRKDLRRNKLTMINDAASPIEMSDNENNSDENHVVDDVLSIKLPLEMLEREFLCCQIFRVDYKTSNKIKVSDSE